MAGGNIVIRRETEEDRRVVESLVRESFWNVYRPGCLEHYVLHRLRDDPAFIPELDFVMERDGTVIGQNVFVRAVIRSDDGRDIPIMTMGPICIAPELRRQGLGKRLLDFSLEKAAAFGYKAVLVEGNPKDDSPRGFVTSADYGITAGPDIHLPHPACLMVKELAEGALEHIHGTVDYSFYNTLHEGE